MSSPFRPLALPPGSPILVRSPNWVGDAVMAIPFYEALRLCLPGHLVVVAARPHAAGIAHMAGGVEVLEYDDRGRHRGARGHLWLAREISGRRFGAAFLLPNSFSSALIPFLARVPVRIGYSKDARGLLLTHGIPWDARARSLHRSEAYLELLKALGFAARRPDCLSRETAPGAREGAAGLLASRGIGAGEPVFGMAPGSMASSRRWPVEHFVRAARELSSRLGARALIFGGPSDRAECAAVARAAAAVDLCSAAGLELLPALIERCRILVSNDSGAAHVASLTRTPALVLFGAGNEAITRPIGGHIHVLRRTPECAPCESNSCARGDLLCMTSLEPEAVVAAALSLVGAR